MRDGEGYEIPLNFAGFRQCALIFAGTNIGTGDQELYYLVIPQMYIMPQSQKIRDGYVKKSYSLEKQTGDLVEKIAEEYGMPKSCVVNIAISRPKKFQKLVRATGDGEIMAAAAVKEEPGLAQQFLDWINEKGIETEAGEEGTEETDEEEE